MQQITKQIAQQLKDVGQVKCTSAQEARSIIDNLKLDKKAYQIIEDTRTKSSYLEDKGTSGMIRTFEVEHEI